MPVIRVSCPTNALTAEQKAQLATLLTDGVMGQEIDPLTDAGRHLTALMFNEIADHNCFLGGTPVEKPRHPGDTFWIVEIFVAAGFFDQARREVVQAAIKKAFVTVLGDDGEVLEQDGVRISPKYLLQLYSLIIEIPEGSWGGSQGELCRRDGRVPPLAWLVERRQFPLERFIDQFMPMVAQEYKEFRAPYPCHNLLFLCGKFHWWLPKRWLHLFSPGLARAYFASVSE